MGGTGALAAAWDVSRALCEFSSPSAQKGVLVALHVGGQLQHFVIVDVEKGETRQLVSVVPDPTSDNQ